MAAPLLPAIDSGSGFRTAARSTDVWSAASVVLIATLTAAAEGLLAIGYVKATYGWPVFLSGHLGIVAMLAFWVAAVGRAGWNTALPLLMAIAVCATGPIGAVAALVTLALSRSRPEDHLLLQAWYERIALAVDTDEITQLYDRVATGRTADLSSVSAQSFSAIIQTGSLSARQSALGVIARSFHPDYLPALMLALKSEEPVIRVQAAAVATRVRVDLRRLVDRYASGDYEGPPGSPASLGAASQLRACIASGLLDEGDRIRAGILAGRLAAPPARSAVALQAAPVLDRLANDAMMLREHRFSEFRVARRIARIASAGPFRIRRRNRDRRERACSRGPR